MDWRAKELFHIGMDSLNSPPLGLEEQWDHWAWKSNETNEPMLYAMCNTRLLIRRAEYMFFFFFFDGKGRIQVELKHITQTHINEG